MSAASLSDVLEGREQYAIHHGDCIEHMASLPGEVFDLIVYSPPFPSVYAYTSEESDLGNSESAREYKLHFGFFFKQIVRLLKPGWVMMVHCAQIPRMKRAGGRGLADFRGLLIRLAERAGFVFEYDWLIRKNPQAQAIRTKSREMQFAGLESDRARSRGALGDYLLKFTAPGDNQTPVCAEGQVSRNEWIELAENCWRDIKETDTLNLDGTKTGDDTKHICPLQLGVIDRLVRLYSDPGELVFSPFAGIGSELYSALKLGRRAYGCELREDWRARAMVNCERAIAQHKASQQDLFSFVQSAK